ncbi:MAG: KGK domain-containing protein [Pseudanabaenaceae cyanobacterium]|jgi:hypothetical protein
MMDNSQYLAPDDVIKFIKTEANSSDMNHICSALGIGSSIEVFQMSDLVNKLCANHNSLQKQVVELFKTEGFPCQVMTSQHRGWQSGKARLTLEFIPDDQSKTKIKSLPPAAPEIPSPLDEIRKQVEG